MARTAKAQVSKRNGVLQFFRENTGDYLCTHPMHGETGMRVAKRDRKRHEQVDEALHTGPLRKPPNVIKHPPKPPAPPPSSPIKQKAREQRQAQKPPNQGAPVSNPSPQPTPKAPTGNAIPTGPGGAISYGFSQWAAQVPSNLEELEIWLYSAKQGLEAAARFIEQGAQAAIIGQGLHPDIAKPLYEAAGATAETGVDYARAYQAVLRIYRPAIEYRELNAPKPQAGYFEQGGSA